MREILFRGKKCDTKDWVFGTLAIYGQAGEEMPVIIPDYASVLFGFYVDPETIGQYTGLCDKNGKKIFEGDVIRAEIIANESCGYNGSCEIGSVVYCNGGFDLQIGTVNGEPCFSNFFEAVKLASIDFRLDVIGNIHDNPELIK